MKRIRVGFLIVGAGLAGSVTGFLLKEAGAAAGQITAEWEFLYKVQGLADRLYCGFGRNRKENAVFSQILYYA